VRESGVDAQEALRVEPALAAAGFGVLGVLGMD
jgi:hypothetical protein